MAFEECVRAQEHAERCECVVTNIERDKWKSLAGELLEHLEAVHKRTRCKNPNCVIEVLKIKAREAGLQ